MTTGTTAAATLGDRMGAAVLLAYLAAVSGFHRGFAHLHVPTPVAPLFSGEIAIVVLGVLLAASAWRRRRLPFRLATPDWLVLCYLAVGAVFAVRGLAAGYGLAALRDFALVYYAVFYLFTRAYLASGQPLLGPVWAISLGATAGAAWQTWTFLAHPALADGHGGPGVLALTAWIAVVALIVLRPTARSPGRRALWWGAVLVDLFAVYLSASRTMLLVGALTLLAVGLVRALRPAAVRPGLLPRLALVIAATTAAIAVHLAVAPPLSPQLAMTGPATRSDAFGAISRRWSFRTVRTGIERPERRTVEEARRLGRRAVPWGSGGIAPSISFRRQAWTNALDRISTAPWIGIGFGPDPDLFPDILCAELPGATSNCGNAHNTYLTVAMRMGIPVLLLFTVLNAVVVTRFATTVRAGMPAGRAADLATLAAVAYAALIGYGALNLLLESPYVASLFWAVLACLAAVAHRRRDESATSAAPAGAGQITP